MTDQVNTLEHAASGIVANHNQFIDPIELTLSFRKQKDETTGEETKRQAVVVKTGTPSVEGLVRIIEGGGKGLELLQAAAREQVEAFIRSLVNDDVSITTENFPYAKLGEDLWETIANQPESERRGRGIPKELWEDFSKSYLEHMPGLTGKPLENIKKQISIMLQKFQPLRAHEKKNEILPNFINVLAIYANNVPEAEQYTSIIEFLVKKAQDFMAVDNSADLEKNLGF